MNNKWYQDNGKLLLALIFLAPLGVFGLIFRKTNKIWLKALGIIFGLFYCLILFIFALGLIVSFTYGTDRLNYENAITDIEKGNFKEAQKNLLEIEPDSEYFKRASIKLVEVDSLIKVEQQKKEIEYQNSLKEIENTKNARIAWTDSIVKSWEGQFIVGNKKTNEDSILFYLSKNASKSFESNRESHLHMLKDSYEKYMKKNVNKDYKDNIVIDFIQDPKIKEELIAKAERNNKLSRFFGFKGQHRNLERLIKSNMNDPDSYEHVNTRWEDKGSYLLIETTIRGTNSFGAKIIKTYRAKADLDGNIIEIND